MEVYVQRVWASVVVQLFNLLRNRNYCVMLFKSCGRSAGTGVVFDVPAELDVSLGTG